MKILQLLLCLFLFSANGLYAQKPLSKTLLWRISGKGLSAPSYLYGTMHLKDRRLFFFGDSVYKCLSYSKGFAMEIDPAELLDSMFNKLTENDTSSLLRKTLDKKKYDAVSKKLENKLGIPAEKITRKKLIELKESWYYKIKKKDDMNTFVDLYLYDIARKQGKWTGGIEDVNDQLDLKDELGKSLSIQDMLEEEDEKKKLNYLEKMITLYTNEDIELIEKMSNDRYSDQTKDIMLINRNIKMAVRIDSLSHIRNCFFAVGAAHLPGDSGLIQLLLNRGYLVEPIFSSGKIAPEKYTFTAAEIPWIIYKDSDSAYTIEIPGKPSELKVGEAEMKLKVYADMINNMAYMCGFSFLAEDEKNEVVYNRMSKSFSGKGFEKLEEKAIIHNGLEGKEIISIKAKYYYRVQLFVVAQKEFTLLVGAEKKEDLFSKNAERFLQSFVANSKLEMKKKDWVLYSNNRHAFEIDFPKKPSIDKLKKGEGMENFETTTYTALDKQTNNYFMAVISQTNKGYFVTEDSTIFNSKLNYYKEQNAKIEDIRKFQFEGYPAMSFSALLKNNGFEFIVKLLIVSRGNRSYTIASITEKGKEDFPDVSRFFKSFKLKDLKPAEWRKFAPQNNVFSTWAPSSFELEKPDTVGLAGTELETKLAESKRVLQYLAYDYNASNTWYVNAEAAAPYYWTDNDSSFLTEQLASYYSDTASEYAKEHPGDFDSLVSKKVVYNGKARGFEIMVKNGSKSFYKRVRILQHGDSSYQLFVLAPYSTITSENNNRFFEDFRFEKEELPTTLFTNKTQEILTDLLSSDSATRMEATTALEKATFTIKDLPLLHNAFLLSYVFDSNNNRSINKAIADIINGLKDSSTITFIKINYANTTPVIDSLKMEMLEMLAKQNNLIATQLIKTFLLTNPPTTDVTLGMFYRFRDSLLLAKELFPECASLFGDSLFGSGLIHTAVVLVDSNLLQKNILVSNSSGILKTAAAHLKQLTVDPTDYPYFYPDILKGLEQLNSKESIQLLNSFVKVQNIEIKQLALLSLIKLNQPALPAELKKVAASLEYRTGFYASLKKIGMEKLFPAEFLTQVKFAESILYQYSLDDESEKATFKFIKEKTVLLNGVQKRFIVFKMISTIEGLTVNHLAICGPFEINKLIPDVTKEFPDAKIFYDEEYPAGNTEKLFEKFIKEMKEEDEAKKK